MISSLNAPSAGLSWWHIIRLGLIQTSLGGIVVLTTSTINRIMVVELALAASTAMGLGRDEVPDLLALSLSGTDYAGHVFGPDSWEYADHLRRADRALARLADGAHRRLYIPTPLELDAIAARATRSPRSAWRRP